MTAPIGATVRMTYDPNPYARVSRGDVLRTKTGRLYRVLDYWTQRRGKHVGRLTITALVIDEMPVEDRKPFDCSDPLEDAPWGAKLELEDGWWGREWDTWYPIGTFTVHELHWNSRDKKGSR